jgi:hypothetical protein
MDVPACGVMICSKDVCKGERCQLCTKDDRLPGYEALNCPVDRLQAQNAQMRDVLVRIGGMMVEPSEMVRLARELVMSTKPVDYHNPADVKRIAELESRQGNETSRADAFVEAEFAAECKECRAGRSACAICVSLGRRIYERI